MQTSLKLAGVAHAFFVEIRCRLPGVCLTHVAPQRGAVGEDPIAKLARKRKLLLLDLFGIGGGLLVRVAVADKESFTLFGRENLQDSFIKLNDSVLRLNITRAHC